MTHDEHKPLSLKSGGRRIPLYAEVGKYFSPDGRLDETALRGSIREALERMKEDNGEEQFLLGAREWLSLYLDQVQSYLEEKGMAEASFQLFRVVMDEATRLGLEKVEVSASRLQRWLARRPAGPERAMEPKRERGDKRKKILAAAIRVFAERGFAEATMDEIAALAGVAKGTLYRSFPSKQELLEEILRDQSREMVERLSRIFSRREDVLGQIQEAIELYVRFIEENHVLYRLIQSEGVVKRAGKRTTFYDHLVSSLPMLKERIVALNTEGKLKTTAFYTVFYGLLGFIDGVAHKWFSAGMEYPLRDEVPVVLEVFFNGFVGERMSGKRFFIPPEEAAAPELPPT